MRLIQQCHLLLKFKICDCNYHTHMYQKLKRAFRRYSQKLKIPAKINREVSQWNLTKQRKKYQKIAYCTCYPSVAAHVTCLKQHGPEMIFRDFLGVKQHKFQILHTHTHTHTFKLFEKQFECVTQAMC